MAVITHAELASKCQIPAIRQITRYWLWSTSGLNFGWDQGVGHWFESHDRLVSSKKVFPLGLKNSLKVASLSI